MSALATASRTAVSGYSGLSMRNAPSTFDETRTLRRSATISSDIITGMGPTISRESRKRSPSALTSAFDVPGITVNERQARGK